MKTPLQPTLPYLNQLLPQLINRHGVVQLFYTPQSPRENARLIVHLESKSEADTLQNQKWVTKLHRHHNTFAHCFYSTQLHYLKKTGNPFILTYCKPAALLYANDQLENHLVLHPTDKKKHLKKYKAYKEQFYHDHDLLQAQIAPLQTADNPAAVLLHYENLLNHDLDLLESLHNGIPTRHQTLNERITSLTQHAPQIQQYFVKKTGNTYYLTDLIEKAKEAPQDLECFFASENYEAFRLAEVGLCDLVEKRLKILKQKIKGKKRRPLAAETVHVSDMSPALPARVMAVLQKINSLEEVYLYHHAVYGETQTYYLLLIGPRLGNTYLKDLTTKLNATSGSGQEYVLIGHSRIWIQKWLFYYQTFFYKIIHKENLAFASSPYHPVPHWEGPYTPEYPDLEHFYKRTKEVYNGFLFMADCHKDNYQGVANLFSLFFQCFCRTYLYAALSYYPNCLNSYALWKLCLYANPALKEYEYLFNRLGTPFFNFLDHYRTIQPTYPFKHKRQTHLLIDLADKLAVELETKVLTIEHCPLNPP